MLAIAWALASAIGYGASDYAAGLAARAASVIRITLLGEAVSILILLLVVPWASTQWPSPDSVAWAAAAGLGGITGAMTLYLGFRHAAFSVAGPLSAVASAGFSVLAGLLFGEHPSTLSLAGIGLALPAIVAVSASPGGGPAGGDPGHRAAGAVYGVAAGACFAILFIGLNRAGSGHDLWPLLISQVAGLVALCLVAAVSRQLKPPPRRAGWLAVAAGAASAAGTTCYFLATHAGLLAVTAVITSLYPGSTILLARVLLGERLTAIRLAGLALAAASVVLIAVGGAG
ncbi:MAG TPA: EamA family transporter [Streptosporangiaceae bacterium]|nr:EamA family transporter [Streptosporangiaceae bacterium]